MLSPRPSGQSIELSTLKEDKTDLLKKFYDNPKIYSLKKRNKKNLLS
jgi:hypothetical protein